MDGGGAIHFLPTHDQRRLAAMQTLALHPVGPSGTRVAPGEQLALGDQVLRTFVGCYKR